MRFRELALPGAFLVEIEPHQDERGFFARTFSEVEFAERGLVSRFVEWSVSYNRRRGTVRGMHYQFGPHGETKLVRCVAGAIHDVILDLRRESPTYLKWAGIDLTADSRAALYVPKGFAHGFESLRDDSEVLYMIDTPYVPEAARGVRWNDPAFDIAWPEPVVVISERDLSFVDWPV